MRFNSLICVQVRENGGLWHPFDGEGLVSWKDFRLSQSPDDEELHR
jgi:hypothetical protein